MDLAQLLPPAYAQALWRQAPVGLALCDVAGRFCDSNEQLSEILGYAQSELVRRSWQDITHPDDLEGDRAQAASLVLHPDDDCARSTKRFLDKRGNAVWTEVTLFAIREDGKLIQYLLWVVPIPESRRYEPARTVPVVRGGMLRQIFDQLRDNPGESALVIVILLIAQCNKELWTMILGFFKLTGHG